MPVPTAAHFSIPESGIEPSPRHKRASIGSARTGKMLRLFFTAVLCVLTLLPEGAQNKVSDTLLGLGEEERNDAFTDLLRDSDVKCDRVIRTLFNGATSDLDVWEALCRDRNSYSLTILSDPNADIALVSCRELRATTACACAAAGPRPRRDDRRSSWCTARIAEPTVKRAI